MFEHCAIAAVESIGIVVCRRMENVAFHSSMALADRDSVEAEDEDGDEQKLMPWTYINVIVAFELQ